QCAFAYCALHAPAVELQHVEADPAIDHVDQSTVVEGDVVALRSRAAARRLRDEPSDLARPQRIRKVDDAQSASEPYGMNDGTGETLRELVSAETRAARSAER